MYICNYKYKDKVYRAVNAANKALGEYKYHLVGGAAGTAVTPSKFYLALFVLGRFREVIISFFLSLSIHLFCFRAT